TRVQVTGPENVPLKIVPLKIPLLPLPVTTKLPPAMKVAPCCRSPLDSPAVEKVRVPRSPVIMPPLLPCAIRVEPVRVNPALLPLKVPPAFVKSTELFANAAIGSARASKNSSANLFMTTFLPQSNVFLFCSLAAPSPQAEALVERNCPAGD